MAKLTRAELADKISGLRSDKVTVDQVRKNEERWGLLKARRDLNKRVVRYEEDVAISILRIAGVI